jgi:hypothetical protein
MKKHTNFWKEIYHKASDSDWLDIAKLAIVAVAVTLIVVEMII